MYRRFRAGDYIIYGLLAIGILSGLVRNPDPFIIPLLVFGAIFLLYKFPPDRWKRTTVTRGKSRSSAGRPTDKEKRKAAFRVIYGTKTDDDDPPRYH